MAVLVPALLMAFLLDALRDPTRRAERLRAHRVYLAVASVGFAGLVVVALAAPGVTGDYGGFFGLRPSLDRILSKSGLQLLALVALGGFAPVLLAAGAACSRRAWRDDRTGPLLAVFWPAALATVAAERLLPRRLPAGALGDRPLRHLRAAAGADPDDGPDRAAGAAVADGDDRRGRCSR